MFEKLCLFAHYDKTKNVIEQIKKGCVVIEIKILYTFVSLGDSDDLAWASERPAGGLRQSTLGCMVRELLTCILSHKSSEGAKIGYPDNQW